MNKLKVFLLAQFAFFAVWGIWLAVTYNQIKANFWLETRPVDPRDVLSGNFIQLSYDIENPKVKSCSKLNKNSSRLVYVKLTSKGPKKLKDGREVNIMSADSCNTKPNYDEENESIVWLTAQAGICEDTVDTPCLKYENLNRYYMNENDSRLKLSTVKTAVNVRLNKKNKLKIVDIAEMQPQDLAISR